MFIKDEIQTKKGAKVIIDTLRALGVDTILAILVELFWICMMNCIVNQR